MSAPTKAIFVSKAARNSKTNRKNDIFSTISDKPWYLHYKTVWNSLSKKLKKLRNEISMKLVNDIIKFIEEYKHSGESIPAVTLCTGTDLSDHDDLFNLISTEIRKGLSCPVVLLNPCQEVSAKYLLGSMIYSFVTGEDVNNALEELELDDENTISKKPIKKLAFTMPHLIEWYEESFKESSKKSRQQNLIIVIPDIESFSAPILRQFLKTISVFKQRLPFILVFGVATSLQNIPDKLSYEVLSTYSLQFFQPQSPVIFLNNVLEKVFLNSDCPFQLGSKVFEFLTTMFLYYNFSVEFFIRGIKLCLMDHFIDSGINVLCCGVAQIPERIKSLSESQLKELSQLPSVMKYKRKNSINEKKVLSRQEIEKLLIELHEHMSSFHVAVRCLFTLSSTLPQSPLGMHIREIYTMSISHDITKTDDFKQSFDLLQHLSKDALMEKIECLTSVLAAHSPDDQLADVLADAMEKLHNFREVIEKSDLSRMVRVPVTSPTSATNTKAKFKHNSSTPTGRGEFLKNLQSGSQPKELTEFEKIKREFLSYLSGNFFKNFLKPSSEFPLGEILVYNRVEVLSSCFDGIPRAILHKAMCDPWYFLQCDCCKIKEKHEILSSFPDICIGYKLHLECGTEVNLYDWLQSFSYKIDDNADGMECNIVDPQIHARFSQVVKDLQFLGFIAPSKRKVDHVKKLKL